MNIFLWEEGRNYCWVVVYDVLLVISLIFLRLKINYEEINLMRILGKWIKKKRNFVDIGNIMYK